jgi:guanylate kinase
VTKTGQERPAIVDMSPDARDGSDPRGERQVASMRPVAGDHLLGEGADDLIGDLRTLRRPRVFFISGPSGVGKDAVIERLRERFPDAFFAVTATTRERRPGEIDGVHYYFLDEGDFHARLADGEFLESANVYGHLYGVLRGPVRAALGRGQDVFVKVDVQGAAEIERVVPGAVSIFLTPESASTLLQRLKHRKTDDPTELMRRFATAQRELEAAQSFDYVVFNRQDRLGEALDEIAAIVRAEWCRTDQSVIHV